MTDHDAVRGADIDLDAICKQVVKLIANGHEGAAAKYGTVGVIVHVAAPLIAADRDALAAEVERLKAKDRAEVVDRAAAIAAALELEAELAAARARVADLEADVARKGRMIGLRFDEAVRLNARVADLEAELAEARAVHVDGDGDRWVQITPGENKWYLLFRGGGGSTLAEIEGFGPAAEQAAS